MKSQLSLAIDATATPIELTGAGYYVHEIISELNNRSIDLKIITRKNDGERFSKAAPNADIIDIAPANKGSRIIFQTTKLAGIVDSLNVDVFHGPHYQIPPKISTHSVVTIHDLTLLTHPDVHTKVKQLFFKRTIPHAISNVNSIITVSNHTTTDLIKLFPNVAKEQIFIAPLGIDNSRFSPQKGDYELEILHSRGITGDYIAFLGTFEPRKSIPTLINAFTLIADDFPDLKLVLAGGKGWGSDQVRDAIVESGFKSRIVTPGRLDHDEIAPFFRNAKIFVYPSLYEGFGMPVAEAMACGVPTITSDSSSMREVAGNGALLVAPGDVDRLAKEMKVILSNKVIHKQMSGSAIKRSHDFSWKTCVDEHLRAYEFALGV